jgi:hypothetical protein
MMMATKILSISPQHVSQILKQEGFVMAPGRQQYGALVQRGLHGASVIVTIQHGVDSKATRLASEAADVLRKHEYTVEQSGYILTVSKKVQ